MKDVNMGHEAHYARGAETQTGLGMITTIGHLPLIQSSGWNNPLSMALYKNIPYPTSKLDNKIKNSHSRKVSSSGFNRCLVSWSQKPIESNSIMKGIFKSILYNGYLIILDIKFWK